MALAVAGRPAWLAVIVVRRAGRAGGGPDDRLPQLRDLRPERPRAREPVRADLADRGAGDLAIRRLPAHRRAPGRCRRSASTSAWPSRRRCWPGGWSGGCGARRRRLRRRSPPRRSPTWRRESAARPTPPPRRSQMAAPLAMLIIVRPLLDFEPARPAPRHADGPVVRPLAAAASSSAAGGCSLLALANGPVGPTSYSPALTGLRPADRRRARLWCWRRPACSPTSTAPPTSPGSFAAAASASRPRSAEPLRSPPAGVAIS